MVNYSIVMRGNPQDKEASKKAYAVSQYISVMNLDSFAKHIATHGCVYSRADIVAILTLAVDCMREQLLAGQKIQLGDLGNFYLSLSSEGALTANDFDPKLHIRSVNVIWERGANFCNLKEDAEFNQVAGRAVQKKVIAAVNNGDTSVELVETTTEASAEAE